MVGLPAYLKIIGHLLPSTARCEWEQRKVNLGRKAPKGEEKSSISLTQSTPLSGVPSEIHLTLCNIWDLCMCVLEVWRARPGKLPSAACYPEDPMNACVNGAPSMTNFYSMPVPIHRWGHWWKSQWQHSSWGIHAARRGWEGQPGWWGTALSHTELRAFFACESLGLVAFGAPVPSNLCNSLCLNSTLVETHGNLLDSVFFHVGLITGGCNTDPNSSSPSLIQWLCGTTFWNEKMAHWLSGSKTHFSVLGVWCA